MCVVCVLRLLLSFDKPYAKAALSFASGTPFSPLYPQIKGKCRSYSISYVHHLPIILQGSRGEFPKTLSGCKLLESHDMSREHDPSVFTPLWSRDRDCF